MELPTNRAIDASYTTHLGIYSEAPPLEASVTAARKDLRAHANKLPKHSRTLDATKLTGPRIRQVGHTQKLTWRTHASTLANPSGTNLPSECASTKTGEKHVMVH